MAMTDKNETPELVARRQAGSEGKLWNVKLLLRNGNATMWRGKENMYGHEVMEFREAVFKVGFQVFIDPGHWQIIPPFDILEVHAYRQSAYFKPEYK